MERNNYWGFTPKQREYARDRANGKCEIFFPDCKRPNTNRVNHIIGSRNGQLAGVSKEVITDIKLNSQLSCELHEVWHDSYEREERQLLETRSIRLIQRRRSKRWRSKKK